MRRGPIQAARRNARGFTLLEAIVALVVFTMGAFALYGWLSTNVITLNRIRERQQIEIATHSALDLIRRSNPMQTPEGQHSVGELTVTWIARPVEPVRAGSSQTGEPTLFMVGLYDMDVRVMRGGRELHAFQVRQVGWKQLYTPES